MRDFRLRAYPPQSDRICSNHFRAPKRLPYVVERPGFPKLAPPAAVVGAIQAVLGGSVPAGIISANTGPFLVAIGHFEPTPGVIQAKLAGGSFAVARDTEFQLKVRVGFVFEPPAGVRAPRVGILTGWLTHGLVDELIGATPGPTPTTWWSTTGEQP